MCQPVRLAFYTLCTACTAQRQRTLVHMHDDVSTIDLENLGLCHGKENLYGEVAIANKQDCNSSSQAGASVSHDIKQSKQLL
jgi:hypothetical protein